MPTLIDITGQRFATFTVRGRAPGTKDARSAWWSVACDCGAELPVRGDSLKGGKSNCPKCSGKAQGRRKQAAARALEIIEANSEFVTECGCLIWTGRIDQHGYGRICVDGREMGAHRASWVLTKGPIPSGLHALHRCDTPPCINPDHLFLGTPADNVADMIRKQRHRLARPKFY